MNTGHGGASGRFEYLKEIAFDYAFYSSLKELIINIFQNFIDYFTWILFVA